MNDKVKRTKEIGALLQQTTSKEIVSDFLRRKDVPHTGTWPELIDKRLVGAVTDNKLAIEDLVELLRSVEEFGKQHVFLQRCKEADAIALMDRKRISSILAARGLSALLVEPAVLDQPAEPTIVDVRWEKANVDLNLTIKLVEQRVSMRQGGLEQLPDGRMARIQFIEKHRAVHVVKLHRNGLLELRIASQSSKSKYEEEVHRVWKYFEPFLPSNFFADVDLTDAKNYMWEHRSENEEVYEYSNHWVRDEYGNVLSAVTAGGRRGLSSNKAVGGGLDYTLKNDSNAYSEGSNCWFKKSSSLSNDVHVLLSGQPNEFTLPANCTKEDYQYVLNQLLFFNK
ncbi:hypothetical protein [Herbaspirillum huttiense]|uniref:hypothetical protein n=1 Tax=Herbaspirillum huttiense TaxID=863372 RepID=UPI002176B172|nr:hypothetical protein [Herbaspirillum huttiense]UWE18057.1 hypothetical protein NY669_07755 [Herbaspirillum huttiense]